MANFKHKVFLLIAKWIPVAVAAGILINNTLAMLDVKDVILDLFDITVGSSLAFVIMMYACSYVFNFFYWHKIVDTNVSKLDKALSLITDEKGMVDGDGLLNDMIDRLIVSKANTINGVTIGEGSIKVTIPFMNKTVIFDKDDFNELKTNIEKYGKSE